MLNIGYIEKIKNESKMLRINNNFKKNMNKRDASSKENLTLQVDDSKISSNDSTEISNEDLKEEVEKNIKKSKVRFFQTDEDTPKIPRDNKKQKKRDSPRKNTEKILDLVGIEEEEEEGSGMTSSAWYIHDGEQLSIGTIPKFSPKHIKNENEFWMYNFKYFVKDSSVETKHYFKKESLRDAILYDGKRMIESHVCNFYGYLTTHPLFIYNRDCIHISSEMIRKVDFNLKTTGENLSRMVSGLFDEAAKQYYIDNNRIVFDQKKDKDVLLSIVSYLTMNYSNSKISNTKRFYKEEEERLLDGICSNKIFSEKFNSELESREFLQKTRTVIANKRGSFSSFFYELRNMYPGWYMVHLMGLMIKEKMKKWKEESKSDIFYVYVPIYSQSRYQTMFDLKKGIDSDGFDNKIGHFTLLFIEIDNERKTFQAFHIDSFSETFNKPLAVDHYNFVSHVLWLTMGLVCKEEMKFIASGWQKNIDTVNCGYFCCYTGYSIMRHDGDKTKWVNEISRVQNKFKEFYFCQFKKMVNTIEVI